MDELESMLRGEHEAVSASLPQTGQDAIHRVRQGARRRRRTRALATSAAAMIAVGAVGVGAWGLVGDNGADGLEPMVSHSPSAEPSPTGASSPTPESTPTASAPAPLAGPPLDDSADGIPEYGYPPLAADRNTAASADARVTYPEAHVMEDWVWDRVGPEWGVGVVSAFADVSFQVNGLSLPPAVMYLHSPDGVYFEVLELPEAAWDDARVVSWHEDERTARVWSRDGGGLFDLTTGEFDPVEFSIGGDPAPMETFVAANAEGDELWFAENDNGGGYYRWTAAEGWAKASLWDVAPTARALSEFPGTESPLTDVDGDRLLLGITEGGGHGELPEELVDYRLSDDTSRVVSPAFPDGASELYAGRWLDGRAVALNLVMPDGYQRITVTMNGEVSLDQRDQDATDEDDGPQYPEDSLAPLPEWVDVVYGEATRRSTAELDCGC